MSSTTAKSTSTWKNIGITSKSPFLILTAALLVGSCRGISPTPTTATMSHDSYFVRGQDGTTKNRHRQLADDRLTAYQNRYNRVQMLRTSTINNNVNDDHFIDMSCGREHEGAGCCDSTCEAFVCDIDEFCCTNGWDDVCANLAWPGGMSYDGDIISDGCPDLSALVCNITLPCEAATNPPTSVPTMLPSTLPTSRAEQDDCVSDNPCVYVCTGDGTIEEAYFAVCVYNAEHDYYKNECIPNDELVGQIPGIGSTANGRLIATCGCCDAVTLAEEVEEGSDVGSIEIKDSDTDFCMNDNPCPAITNNLCKTDVGDKVKVNICKEYSDGKLKDECKEPWWLPSKSDESVFGCGVCPNE